MSSLCEIGKEALKNAKSAHDCLGLRGLEMQEKNRFGEMALACDYQAEVAVLNTLHKHNVPIKVRSEEHREDDPRTQVTDAPRFTGVLDGIDGTKLYREGPFGGLYATLFSILRGTNPTYADYEFNGAMQHATGKLYYAVPGRGSHIDNGKQLLPYIHPKKHPLIKILRSMLTNTLMRS